MLSHLCKIQAGCKKWQKNTLLKNEPMASSIPPRQKFPKTALSQNVFEMNVFLHFRQKFKMAAKNGRKTISGNDSAYTLWAKNLVKIILPHTVSKIHKFLHFMQKFKMATKYSGKTFLAKLPYNSAYTLIYKFHPNHSILHRF